MFCKNCGKELEDSAKFCSGCGASTGISTNIGLNLRDPGERDFQGNAKSGGQYVYGSNGSQWSYGAGAKIWLGLCMIVNCLSGLVILLEQTQIVLGLIGIGVAICYGILFLKRNLYAFYGICVCEVINVVYSLMIGLSFGMALTALINPLVTFFIIRKYYFAS